MHPDCGVQIVLGPRADTVHVDVPRYCKLYLPPSWFTIVVSINGTYMYVRKGIICRSCIHVEAARSLQRWLDTVCSVFPRHF